MRAQVVHGQGEAEGEEFRRVQQAGEGKFLGGVGTQGAGQQPGFQISAAGGERLALRRVGVALVRRGQDAPVAQGGNDALC